MLQFVDEVTNFKPVFNKARGTLDASSPHARNAALFPFLLHAYVCELGTLQILASDFHSNTWHTRLSPENIMGLKNELACGENFQIFLQTFHDALSSTELKMELGGSASAVGGKGATMAKLKAMLNDSGIMRELVLPLDSLKGWSATDAFGALALDLYDAFVSAQSRVTELEATLDYEKQRASNVLDAVLEGKLDCIHFRQSALPNSQQTNVQPSWPDATSPGILLPTQSLAPSASLSSYLSPSLTSSQPNEFPSGYSLELAQKPFKSSKHSLSSNCRLSSNTSLKLSNENSYSRSMKKKENLAGQIMEESADNNEGLVTGVYGPNNCNGDAVRSHIGGEKKKYRELDLDLLGKIESGGENRSAKTDSWARRHYYEWQKNFGLPEKEIEELPLQEFAENLVKFFCMVKKRNGDLFPSESLKAMFRGFVRIIQSHYKRLSLQGNYSGPIVDASKDIMFEKARISCIEAMKHSLLEGASGKRRKADTLMPSISQDVLSMTEYQVSTPKGLARRLCYYAIHIFGIDGSMELYDTTDIEFQRIVDEPGDVLWEYNERRAEKYKSKEIFHDIVRCGNKDVIECFDNYYTHLPPKPLVNEPRRLFLAPIKRPTTSVWFRHQNISSRTLLEWHKSIKPLLSELHDARTGIHSSPLLSCHGDCRGKGPDSAANVNLPTVNNDDPHMRNSKNTREGICMEVVDVSNDTDQESTEADDMMDEQAID